MSDDNTQFDPRAHMTNIKGGRYLPVSARILWFRSEHPEADVQAELVRLDDEVGAVFMCRIIVPDGGAATGWGSCRPQDFPDGFIEKAETKARGRALAALGYGTPEDEDEAGVLADGPIGGQAPQRGQYAGRGTAQNGQAAQGNAFLATAPQKSRIQRLAAEQQIQPDELNQLILQNTGTDFQNMNKRQASGVIDLLEARRPQAASR